MKCDLKPFNAIQRVRLPPGKGKPAGRKRALQGVVATSFLKRRQQVLKPRDSPDMVNTLKPSLSYEWGQHRRNHQ